METHASERLSVEEVANCATHGFGLALSVAGFAALVALYLASTLYHAARTPRSKRLLRVLDHCGIYLLIAGTYTAFTLVTLRGPWGWTLFGLVWGLALAGIVFRVVFGGRYRPPAAAAYVLPGWLCGVAAKPILELVPLGALAWIAAGGLAYTTGVFFFAARRIPHHHAIWHLFVLGGSICHYVAVLLYVLPARG